MKKEGGEEKEVCVLGEGGEEGGGGGKGDGLCVWGGTNKTRNIITSRKRRRHGVRGHHQRG